jgi:hypothetical protein
MPAAAGIYEVQSCPAQVALPFHGQFERYGANRVDVVENCNMRPNGFLSIAQTRKGTSFSAGEGAGYRWYAPSGTAFIRSRVYGKLKNANGIAAQIYATNASGGYLALDQGASHDGNARYLKVDFDKQARSQIAIRLACLTKPPCSNKASDTKAFVEMSQLRFWLSDTSPPEVQLTGELASQIKQRKPLRGTHQLTFKAKDAGAGLRETFVEVNGTRTLMAHHDCSGLKDGYVTRTQPCSLEALRNVSFNTAASPFREGKNAIRVCASDYANQGSANLGCSDTFEIRVDNEAPPPPQNLRVLDGSDWRAVNRFDLEWTNAGNQTTPIVAATFQIYDADTGLPATSETTITAENVSTLKGVKVPRPGRFLVSVRLLDEAGNLGKAASAELRFDDRRPAQIRLDSDLGWFGAIDLPLRLSVPLPAAAGPSGLKGLAHSLTSQTLQQNGLPPVGAPPVLCPNDNCRGAAISPPLAAGDPADRSESALELGRLDEGLYRLDLAAVSGAWLPSVKQQTTTFGVDLTDPETTVRGVPNGWVRSSVLVQAHAWDGQSGMSVEPETDQPPPITVIESGEGGRVEQIGDRASLLITGEGVHHLHFWARDRAGNANNGRRLTNGYRHDPPVEAMVRIDRTAPQVRFLKSTPSDPDLVQVAVSDATSGVTGGAIYYRPLADGADARFVRLPTTFGSGRLQARLPSDDLPPGLYELRATAKDRAGNGAKDPAAKGAASTRLSLPLKPKPALALAFTAGASLRRSLTSGETATVIGRARDPQGRPMASTHLKLIERFDPGSRQPQRERMVTTDANGNFRALLAPGPSRSVIASFAGNRQLGRAESNPLHLSWPARVVMRLSPQISRNGRTVRMRGRVWGPAGSMPATGKLVAIQFFDVNRRRWRPVDLLRTDAKGRFRFSYRFRTVTSPQRFSFRAAAPGEAGWPYRPARSGRSDVVVYPR